MGFQSGKTTGFGRSRDKFGKLTAKADLRRNNDPNNLQKVYNEFVASFEAEDAPKFVPGGTLNPSQPPSDSSSQTPYMSPCSQPPTVVPPAPVSSLELPGPEAPAPQVVPGRKKRNLDLFMEELKRGQEERENRHKTRHGRPIGGDSDGRPGGSHDTGDPSTTNLYLGNLSPQVNEEMICRAFAQYGPIGSVKVMWPRTQEEFDRNRNCGFVSFMQRADAARAIKAMDGVSMLGHMLSVGWGKAVPLPPKPIFVLEEDTDTPPTGLPFNAQIPKIATAVERILRYGPAFEALLMDREWNNPEFSFLFSYESPEHVYYRWKLFSMLQGDRHNNWRTEPFRMFFNGPLWIPPDVPFDDHIIDEADSDLEAEELNERDNFPKGTLGRQARLRLQRMLRKLQPKRGDILRAMMFVIEHADASDQVVDVITQSLVLEDTPPSVKIARLYLVSDILFNSGMSVPHAWQLRKSFQPKLPEIFASLNRTYLSIDARLKSEQFKNQVLSALQAWEKWMIFPQLFMASLTGTFLKGSSDKLRDPEVEGGSPGISAYS
ncbi:hypothetical protein H4R33_005673 [Dimargaris cristalligena]|nr:hypothetical protein H4R33_005673 [Dimargaris cristalligena]